MHNNRCYYLLHYGDHIETSFWCVYVDDTWFAIISPIQSSSCLIVGFCRKVVCLNRLFVDFLFLLILLFVWIPKYFSGITLLIQCDNPPLVRHPP